ncbi:OsmC family protein [Thermoflexus sp.]|uniref:OsmC family protein n=1 Tax=Thermoflexus sp. TaxID=1969742 RepID=UPI0025D727B9|nr:OsmC family protein [Thermoflexus sp.]MDW8064162.1 OsmC family protein [Anaerolineae bacterium]MCS6963247.1 OsmC family protein [Thermoflexus sp.]MCS7351457.1 OsmC family protein [Thermoflexus sp.]MCX7691232.1 OsmC family protein [Thermoflexus sp.]MDW8180914.1 OsmC family protein [Anaerolineae bacterium]
MAEVQIKWLEKRQFVGIDSTRHSVVISGTGPEDGVGMKPAELLLIALGACSAFDVLDILEKKRQRVTGLEVRVQGEQDPDPPWAFRRIRLIYRVRGRGLSPKAVEDAIRLSEEKYCSVSATVRGVAEITHAIEILEEER